MSEQQSRIPQQHRTTRQPLYFSDEDFHGCLVNFFRPFASTRPMDWTCVQKSMTFFASFFKFRPLLDLYFDYVFGLFEDFRITDRAVIHACVEVYCKGKLSHCVYRPSFQFAGDVLLSDPSSYRDLSVVKRTLRYVAPVLIKWDDLYLYDYFRYVLRTICWEDSFGLDDDDPIYYDVKPYSEVEGRRFQLTLMVLEFILQFRTDDCDDMIKGLRLLFQAIPVPQVTWTEILGFLKSHITCSPSDRMDSYISSLKESCKECYPECLQVPEPRSLKHLARCEVRRCMGQARTLPHGVWDLRLPRELEDFVLLQTRKDQFRPVIRPLSSEKVYSLVPMRRIQTQESLGPVRS